MPEGKDKAPPATAQGRTDAIRAQLTTDGFGGCRVHTDFCRDLAAHRVFAPMLNPPRDIMETVADRLLAIRWIARTKIMPLGVWVSASSLLPEALRPRYPSRPPPRPDAKPPLQCTVACQEARVTFPSDCTCVCEGEFHGGSGHPWRQDGDHLLVAPR